MFQPRDIIWRELRHALSGIWFDVTRDGEPFIVIKAQAHIVKAVFRGASAELCGAVVGCNQANVICVGLRMHDDPEHPVTVFSTLPPDERSALISALKYGSFGVAFFDELSRNVMCSRGAIGGQAGTSLLNLLESDQPLFPFQAPKERLPALDEFEKLLEGWRADSAHAPDGMYVIPLQIAHHDVMQIRSVSFEGVDGFEIDAAREGYGLEQSVLELLENAFLAHLHLSPEVDDGGTFRELTDVLCYTGAGVLLVECKVLAVHDAPTNRTSVRKGLATFKLINKGLRQLPAAAAALRQGRPLRTRRGEPIQPPSRAMEFVQGAIVVSELISSVDWSDVCAKTAEASQQAQIPIQVLDLVELRCLRGVSEDPDILLLNLVRRFGGCMKHRTALVRASL